MTVEAGARGRSREERSASREERMRSREERRRSREERRRSRQARIGDPHAAALRRFSVAALVGTAVAAIPFVWTLWDLWTATPDPLRSTETETNFYDLQARAMLHGHLYVPNGSIGVEGFIHAGREYTYFGLFPSIIRLPILLVTHSLDGKLTAPSILVAWVLTCFLSSMLIWRVRLMIRGSAAMGRVEAVSLGALIATIGAGSVFMSLAATPFVFSEDLAWSIALTIGSFFALLGVIEKPTKARIAWSGVFILAANLNRITTGWSCVIGAVLVAGWFFFGYGGTENRGKWKWVIVAALVPLAVGCAVNWLKFGTPFGLPVEDQVYTFVNAYRRKFLASNGGQEYGVRFLPSTISAYFQPTGIRFGTVFPFVTLPGFPAHAVGGVLFDRRYRTASIPASMPLLFLLACWGVVTALRPRPVGRVRPIALLIVASACSGGAILLWGYLAERYLADFMPVLILASVVGMIDLCRRFESFDKRFARVLAGGGVLLLALFSIVANAGIADTPNEEWTSAQALAYVNQQVSISNVTGHPIDSRIVKGSKLPYWAPSDEIFDAGDCSGLYVSDGENYSVAPEQQAEHTTWVPVEQGPEYVHTLDITFGHPRAGAGPVPLVKVGRNTVTVEPSGKPADGYMGVLFRVAGAPFPSLTHAALIKLGNTYSVTIVTDPMLDVAEVSLKDGTYLNGTLSAASNRRVDVQTRAFDTDAAWPLQVSNGGDRPSMSLCHSLAG